MTTFDEVREVSCRKASTWILGRATELACEDGVELEDVDLDRLARRGRRGARLIARLTTPDESLQESVYAAAIDGVEHGLDKLRRILARRARDEAEGRYDDE